MGLISGQGGTQGQLCDSSGIEAKFGIREKFPNLRIGILK